MERYRPQLSIVQGGGLLPVKPTDTDKSGGVLPPSNTDDTQTGSENKNAQDKSTALTQSVVLPASPKGNEADFSSVIHEVGISTELNYSREHYFISTGSSGTYAREDSATDSWQPEIITLDYLWNPILKGVGGSGRSGNDGLHLETVWADDKALDIQWQIDISPAQATKP